MLPALAAIGLLPALPARAQAPAASCAREISADVVAIDQAVQFNRYGAHYPAFMIYALRDDVVPVSGETLAPGNARLREDKRPRPLVLRMNVGDCLTINFQNLLNPTPVSSSADGAVSIDQPATRAAGIHVQGLSYTRGMQDDGAHVGQNASSLVQPGAATSYRLHATAEGTFLFYNQAVTTGGEANTGSLSFGMFGAVTVQPAGTEWYRSQVSRAELDLATERDAQGLPVLLATGHPRVDYDAVFPAGHPLAGRPVLRMLDGSRIVHGDLHAIVTGQGRGPLAETYVRNPVLEPNREQEQGPGAGTRARNEPYREFTVLFHDEVKSIQAFPQFEDPVLGHTLHGVRDAFGINYGITGAGAQVLANRLGVGPASHCAECKYEEFFLSSWVGNDPALLVDVPASAALRPDGTVDPTVRATRALYPADPANVFPSYLNDRVRIRNVHAGAEQHVFHLHAHQWLANPDSTGAAYLDSQFIAPGTGRTYEIAFNGSGNRNQTAGDSILHCHLYPHFAQGMWGLWRVHDTFEWGTELDAEGRPLPTARAYPDGEIETGTPIYALVPVPGMALAPLPAPVRIEAGQVALANTGDDAADNPGFPFFVPGQAGHRPPPPPLDTIHDGGLRRHVALGGEAVSHLDRLDMSKELETLAVRWLDEHGEAVERAAMAFHARRTHDSVTHDGTPRAFVTNGRAPVRGAPFADPCGDDVGGTQNVNPSLRTYRGATFQMRLVMNRAGWHTPQARLIALWHDVAPTLAGTRAPEPLVMRAHSGDCVEYQHTNLVPYIYELDDYQVRTPTDIISQHIHLVKFDVLASDGGGNGWNYEDGTMAPGEVRERIAAIRRHNNCSAGDEGPNCPLAVPHPFFGAGANNEWLGAMTTVQRWYADPVTDERGVDRGLGTVFTHDHFGPSTHQQVGLYASLAIQPRDSTWYGNETDQRLSVGRDDGGPTSWAARIVTPNPADSHREFNLQVSDFVHAYLPGGGVDAMGRPIPDPARVINPPVRARTGLPYLIGREQDCPGGAPLPCPQAISVADVGTYTVNYRNEPLAHRLYAPNANRSDGSGRGALASGVAGDPAHAFRSDITRAMAEYNRQPSVYPPLTQGVQPGDPWTPLLRAYKGDRIRVRLLAGAHEEPHIAHLHGLRWLANPDDPNSGWRAAQVLALSEHFEFNAPLVAPSGDPPLTLDYLYAGSHGVDGLWNGAWGLLRAHEFLQSSLRPLPNNAPPARPNGVSLRGLTQRVKNLPDFNGVCPVSAPLRRYAVSAVSASAAIGPNGITWNDRQGAYAGQRGPIVDPTGALYVLNSDLDRNGRLLPGRNVEPLVLRAAAGDCIEVTLTNRLPSGWADSVIARANHHFVALPFLVDNFNMNQVRPSSEVGLHPQLVATDISRSYGLNVGMNLSPGMTGRSVMPQTAPVGGSVTYRWYAGVLQEVPDAGGGTRLQATPVEFGGVNLMPADPLRHAGKGLVAALVVLPQGATWTEDSATRTQATVRAGDRTFRDLVLVSHDDVGLRASGAPVCFAGAQEGGDGEEPVSIATTGCRGLEDAQDAGNAGFNYRTEPMWFRLGHPPGEAFELTREIDYARALSNGVAGGGDPRTPVFRAPAGQEVRFRLLQGGGHARTGSFTVHGHAFVERPYSAGAAAPSQSIEGVRSRPGFRPGQTLGTVEGIGPGNHFDVVLEQAGGPFRVPGDYLFRNMFPLGFDAGQWGILRVTP